MDANSLTRAQRVLSCVARYTLPPERVAAEVGGGADTSAYAKEIDDLVSRGAVTVRHDLLRLTPAGQALVTAYDPNALEPAF